MCTKTVHISDINQLTSDPKTMGKAALVEALRIRGLDTKGCVAALKQRLLGALVGED